MSSWSELPHDLLVEVTGHIQKLEDLFAFRAVCKGWLAAGKKEYFKGLWLRQMTPYLMLPVRDDNNDNAREFYSLVESEIVASVRVPKFKVRKCFESLGWLLAIENDGTMCLLDPFSSVEIPLPHQNTFPGPEAMEKYVFVAKMVLSARPSETSDFILMILCGSSGRLGFWRLGDESWNRIEFWKCIYCDVMYYGEHFYAIDGIGCAYSFTLEGDKVLEHRTITRLDVFTDVENSHCRNIDASVWRDTLYILKTSESLLLISRTATWYSKREHRIYYNTNQFRVYQVNMSTGKWTEINNVGSMAIFVGQNTTFAIDTCRYFGKIKANHIYFSDDGWECYHYNQKAEGGGRDMGAYNMETGKIDPFYSGDVLLSKVCPSVWISPSF